MEFPDSRLPYVMTYMGHCHGGDFDLIIRIISAAARVGVRAIVMDRFRAESLAKPGVDAEYPRYKRAELRPTQYRQIEDLCDELQLDLIDHALDLPSLEQIGESPRGVWVDLESPIFEQVTELAVQSASPLYVQSCCKSIPQAMNLPPEAHAYVQQKKLGSEFQVVAQLSQGFPRHSERQSVWGMINQTSCPKSSAGTLHAGAGLVCHSLTHLEWTDQSRVSSLALTQQWAVGIHSFYEQMEFTRAA
jgi:hypothetical protein